MLSQGEAAAVQIQFINIILHLYNQKKLVHEIRQYGSKFQPKIIMTGLCQLPEELGVRPPNHGETSLASGEAPTSMGDGEC